ncbi:Chloride channel core [Hyella patelloides LEGE 07179]|uniref:Chloride channel core n=1 Tax=Hyella patelloides LEGE 07179 TaxID=945734 RepID=A0A563VKB2_9CYAN|nr:chloride channel protein [Hyella patelloides]VEP11874.1 Chloride channel core [Hyella patelloides LEGE 07179]
MKNLLAKWWNSRVLATSSVDTRYALIEACAIGFFSGLTALLLKQGVGLLGGYRLELARAWGASWALPLIGLVMGFLAGWAVELLSPAAAGGGIPQVKAALARYPIKLNLRVALVKTLGTIFVLGAGLTLGRRGPTVHIGAALAAQISSWLPNSPTNRRQTIAAGAAAGLAAGFNTPIAGVLFVIEELMRDASGLTLETAIAASFTGAVVSRLFNSSDLNLPQVLLDTNSRSSFAVEEIPFYLVLGILAGVLGGLFNRGIIFGVRWNRKLPISMPLRVGLAGLISGLVIAFLPEFFRDNTGLREFVIAGELTWQITAIAFMAHFFLTILAYSSGAPGGVFAPALVLGSALGYLVGMAEVNLIGTESSYTFALAGMGAFFTSVVRVPVTAIVIVFEMTADFNLVLPLMISCAIAYITAEGVSRGSLYEHLLEVSGIDFKEETPTRDFLSQLTAFDVMESQVETLSSQISIKETIAAMSQSHHRGFPVVDDGKLVGIVTQSDIADARRENAVGLLHDIMTPQPITVNSKTSLADVLYLLNRYQLSRLPVTEGNKLIGIITRSDIIKAEAKQLLGDREICKQSEPSYITYQTRSPATGRGRILLPVSNPENAKPLMNIAIAIAKYQKYEIECLQVICVPKYIYPAQAKVKTGDARHLMQRLERLGRKSNIPVHTQVRIANNVSAAILETLIQEQICLLITGWRGKHLTPENIFSNVVDTLIEKATCDLVLIKLGTYNNCFPQSVDKKVGKWLIPTAGGNNIQQSIKILPGLASLYNSAHTPKVTLCQVYTPNQGAFNFYSIRKLAKAIANNTNLAVKALPIRAYSVPEAILRLHNAEKYDLVVLGASSEGMLQNVMSGNIPKEIVRKVSTTVIIVRSGHKIGT